MNKSNMWVSNTIDMFNQIRKQGWQGIFLADKWWIVILGTYSFSGKAANDNKAKE